MSRDNFTSITVHLTKGEHLLLEDAKWKHRLSKSDVVRRGIADMAAKPVEDEE